MNPRHKNGEEYVQFLLFAAGYRSKKWDERVGQAFFNILNMEFPEIANKIRSSHLDPFFHDSVADDVVAEVVRLYNEMLYYSKLPTAPVQIVEKYEHE